MKVYIILVNLKFAITVNDYTDNLQYFVPPENFQYFMQPLPLAVFTMRVKTYYMINVLNNSKTCQMFHINYITLV